ncbi:MAG: hypothetical protein QXD23_01310 [Candidatus Micrarchaeaceae archaeon]
MKAQFWSFDAVFGIILFIFGLIILTYAWITISNNYSSVSSNNAGSMQSELTKLNYIIFYSGTPSNWDSIINVSNTLTWSGISVGLGTLSNNKDLSENKLMSFLAMSNTNYSLTKEALGISYDYYINISSKNFNLEIGKNPIPLSPTSINVVSEPVIVNGYPAKLTLEVWTNTTFGII